MAVYEQLKSTLLAVCASGVPTDITEFYAQLSAKSDTWGKAYIRTSTAKSSLLRASNDFRMRAFPMNTQTFAEFTDFQTYALTICTP